jgi:hypothetical protein
MELVTDQIFLPIKSLLRICTTFRFKSLSGIMFGSSRIKRRTTSKSSGSNLLLLPASVLGDPLHLPPLLHRQKEVRNPGVQATLQPLELATLLSTTLASAT